jgi:hypothetical protein
VGRSWAPPGFMGTSLDHLTASQGCPLFYATEMTSS